jgi:meso-butanediol dehydrogenase/(S,S)-butanediol dehydrogenase/diacetyl reductase
MRLKNRNAFVTGAGSGIGRACAQRLLAEGANVLAVDIDSASLDWIRGVPNGDAMAVSVAGDDANHAIVERVMTTWGPVTIAHLNAAAVRMGSIMNEDNGLDDCIEINLKSIAHGIRAAAASMIAAGGGSIIVTNSSCGLSGDAGVFAYSATKAGALGMVRAAAADLALQRIRINAVCPGPIATELAERVRREHPEQTEYFRKRVPMQRWGLPEEVAAVVAFLASDDASYVTGIALPVDGGLSATAALFPVNGAA